MLSQLLMNQDDLTIVNMPTERRRLPETPLQREIRERNLSLQTPEPQVPVMNSRAPNRNELTQFHPVDNREITNQGLANSRRLTAMGQDRNP